MLYKEQWRFHPSQRYGSRMGPALASATTVAPTHPVHHITGTAAIVNITPPEDPTQWQGEVTFIADGAYTWTAAGNIAVASAAAQTVGGYKKFVYDPVTQKWYPSGTVAG